MEDLRDEDAVTKSGPKFVSLLSPEDDEAWRRDSKKARIRQLSIAAVVIGIAATAYVFIPFRSPCDDPEQAYDASKAFVLRRLKSPSTASIPWNIPSDATVMGLSCKYAVTAYADAENSFGARGRVWYVAHMEYNRDRHRWELNNLTVDPPEGILQALRGW